jgi:hypothetical protein
LPVTAVADCELKVVRDQPLAGVIVIPVTFTAAAEPFSIVALSAHVIVPLAVTLMFSVVGTVTLKVGVSTVSVTSVVGSLLFVVARALGVMARRRRIAVRLAVSFVGIRMGILAPFIAGGAIAAFLL